MLAGGFRRARAPKLTAFTVWAFRLLASMTFGAALEYFTFLEKQDFQPGDEIGLKGSVSWKLLWDHDAYSGWKFDYAFLYRWRIQKSENLNMDKPYRKMDDLYRGFNMRVDAARYFTLWRESLGVSLFYEINRGNLFGMETGHTIGIYSKIMFGN